MNIVLQEREKNILAILSVIAVIIVFMYLFRPSGQKYHKLKSDVTRLQTELRNPKAKKEDVKDFEDKVKLLRENIKTLSYQIPTTEKRGFLIKDLEDLAKENKIEIISFLPKEAIPVTMTGKEITKRMKKYRRKHDQFQEHHAKVLKTVINIDSKGKFGNYSKFFSDIITYYRAVEVSDLIMTRSGAAGGRAADRRFGGGRKKQDPLEEAKNMDLNVSFTLLAYTSIPESKVKKAR